MVYTQPGTDRKVNKDVSHLGRADTNHLVHNSIRRVGGSQFAMRPNDGRVLARQNWINLGPDSLPPQGLVISDTFFDIRLTGAAVHTLWTVVLRITVTNTNSGATPTSVKPLLPFYFFNRIEVMANGSFTDDTVYPTQMYLRHMFGHQTFAQKTSQAFGLGMETKGPVSTSSAQTTWTTYDEDQIAIAPGTQRNYFIPINNFLTTTNLYLPGKKQDPRLRFYLASNPICSNNAAADLTGTPLLLSAAEIILNGVIYQSEIMNNLTAYYIGTPCIMPAILHERQVIDVKSITALTEVADLPLTALNGEYSGLFIWLQRGNASRENLYSSNSNYTAATVGWLPIVRFSLKDSSGNPVGYNSIIGNYIKTQMMSQDFPDCCMGTFKDIYWYGFCTDAVGSFKNGTSSGGLAFDSNFTISFVPGAFTTGTETNYNLILFGARKGLFTLNGPEGTFSVTKL